MGGISTRVDTDYSYLLKKDVKKEEVTETVKNEEPEVLGNAAPVEPVNQEEVSEVSAVQFADEDPVITEENTSSAAVISTEDINDPVTADDTPAESLRAKQETKEEKAGKSADTKKKGGRKKKN